MRAPSLYTHFASKHAIYDAMFGQAWSEFERVALAGSQSSRRLRERRSVELRACFSTSRSPTRHATSS